MSTATENRTEVKTLDDELNRQIQSGAILEAFERFYADDVAMAHIAEIADPEEKYATS